MRKGIVVAVLVLVTWACGSSPTGPGSSTLSGTWKGTVSSTYAGNGNITFTLAQDHSTVSGQWATTFTNSPANGGSAHGSLNGATLTATLTPGSPGLCPFNVTATLSGNTMSGTYAAYNCSIPDAGSFSVTKQ